MMTRENCLAAMRESIALVENDPLYLAKHQHSAVPAATVEHFKDMLVRAEAMTEWNPRKVGAWLGWIQGTIYVASDGRHSLEAFKQINLRNSTPDRSYRWIESWERPDGKSDVTLEDRETAEQIVLQGVDWNTALPEGLDEGADPMTLCFTFNYDTVSAE